MTDTVLVTGASGLIGRHVVARLLAAGLPVRVLVRDRKRLGTGIAPRVCVVEGDLRDRRAIASAVEGAGTVLHLAACARAWSRDPEEFAAVNVQGVAMLLDAAADAGVERFVHVSTVLTLPHLRPDRWEGSRRLTPYEETKLIGERLVDAYAAGGRHAVVVHPTRVYGPGPLNDANGVTRLVALYLSSPVVPRLRDGDVLANYVHAGDVAEGILLAAERGRSGGHYILGGENSSLRGMLYLVGELSGIWRRTFAVPRTVALAAAHAAVLWGHLGGTPPITPAWMRSYFDDQRVDVTPSCRELGYHHRSLRDGLEETIAWLHRRLPVAS
jgi:nucleoside-diphosphate-sugar epimerase